MVIARMVDLETMHKAMAKYFFSFLLGTYVILCPLFFAFAYYGEGTYGTYQYSLAIPDSNTSNPTTSNKPFSMNTDSLDTPTTPMVESVPVETSVSEPSSIEQQGSTNKEQVIEENNTITEESITPTENAEELVDDKKATTSIISTVKTAISSTTGKIILIVVGIIAFILLIWYNLTQ